MNIGANIQKRKLKRFCQLLFVLKRMIFEQSVILIDLIYVKSI